MSCTNYGDFIGSLVHGSSGDGSEGFWPTIVVQPSEQANITVQCMPSPCPDTTEVEARFVGANGTVAANPR